MKKDRKVIKNPMLGLIATEDNEVMFLLYGESGEREEISYDSEPALYEATRMMASGQVILRSLHDIGFRPTLAEYELEEDLSEDDEEDPDDETLDNPDESE